MLRETVVEIKIFCARSVSVTFSCTNSFHTLLISTSMMTIYDLGNLAIYKCLIKTGYRNGKQFPPNRRKKGKSVCVSVCVSVWTHVLVCPGAQRAFEPEELIPPIRISLLGKGTNMPFNSNGLQKTYTSSHTDTHHKLQLSLLFLWFLLFSSLPSPLIKDKWSLSEILKPITLTSHCWHSNPLHFYWSPVLLAVFNHIPLSIFHSTLLLLSQNHSQVSHTLDLFSGMWKSTLLFPWLVFDTLKGKFLGYSDK